MRLFFSALILLSLYVHCLPYPRCCYQPYNLVDFLFTLRCGVSPCQKNEEVTGNLCIYCKSKTSNVNKVIINSTSTLKISKPYILCQDFIDSNETNTNHLVLSWSWSETVTSPFIFMIEARNYSKEIGTWGVIGVTNATFAEISHLDSLLKYQFRVTPVITASSTLLPATSNWTKLLNSNIPLSPITNVSVSEFQVKDGLVNATVKWTTSEEIPCSYKLVLFPATGGDYFQEKTIILPYDNLPVVLPGLMFEVNYTVTIIPNVVSRKVKSAKIWFITPTCLDLTGGNFSICAPGCPQNVSAYWNSGNEAVINWIPPIFTSPENPILGYHISVIESVDIFPSSIQYIAFKSVKKDFLNVSFQYLNSNTQYTFEVRAVSKGGTGNPAVVELPAQELAVMSMPTYSPPYHYIVPGLGIPLLITIIAVVIALFRKRVNRKKGVPSGLADVNDYIRPYLVPVDKIELHEVVGKGAFGIVHRGILTRSKSKEEVAVKVFPSETITRHQLLHEVELMCIVGRHDQIVGFQGFTLDIEKMYLILEYCPLGDLHSYLVNLKPELMQMKSLPPAERMYTILENGGYGRQLCSYIYQVAIGMEYIASLKLIHRDLAARNILLLNKNRVKIGDFGLSKDVYETKVYSGNFQKKLPIKWMAPEAIEKQKFTTHSDVWSFGVFMWEVFKLGKEPYPDLTSSNVLDYLKMGYRLEKPHCTQDWYNLMCSCWRKTPKDRPQFREIVIQIRALIDKMWYYLTLS